MAGAMSPNVTDKDPFTAVLATTQEAKEAGHLDVVEVLRQNIQMARGVETAGHLLLVLRIWEVVLFVEAQKKTEQVPMQDVVKEEMDCFRGQVAQ